MKLRLKNQNKEGYSNRRRGVLNIYCGLYQRIFKIANREVIFGEGICEEEYEADGKDMILTLSDEPDGAELDDILKLKNVELVKE